LCQNSEIGPILQQIQDLSRSFVEFSFVYSSRECNRLAHECAKLVSRNNLVEEWLEPPPGLRGIMEAECNPSRDPIVRLRAVKGASTPFFRVVVEDQQRTTVHLF
jgi:hypothetical protein